MRAFGFLSMFLTDYRLNSGCKSRHSLPSHLWQYITDIMTKLVQIAVGVSIRDNLRKLNCYEQWRGILYQSARIRLYYEILSQADGFHQIFRRAHVPDKHGRDR